MIHESDWDGADKLVEKSLTVISKAYKSGKVSEIEKLEQRFEAEKFSIDPEGDVGAMKHAIIDACVGECESLRGRLTGDLLLFKSGINRVAKFVSFIESHSFSEEYVRDRAMCRAKSIMGNLLGRKGYITMDPSDFDRAALVLFEANALRHSYLTNSRPGIEDFDKEVIPLRARIHRDMADVYVGQLIWDDEVYLDGAAITMASEAVEDFRGICIRADDSKAGEIGSLDFFDDPNVTEMFASRATLAIAIAVTIDRISTDRMRRGKGRSQQDPSYFSRSVDVEALHNRGLQVIEESYRAILEKMQVRELDTVPHRWARTLSTFGFAAETLWRHRTESDQLFEISEWFFQGALKRYRASEHPFRRAVNLEGYAGLLLEKSSIVGEQAFSVEKHRKIAEMLTEAAEHFGKFNHIERKQSCLSGVAIRRKVISMIDSQGSSLAEDFGNASIDRIVGELKPDVPDSAIERLESILTEAQREAPDQPREFVQSFNSAMDALGLTIRVKGQQGYARLGVSRNSIRLQMNDSGARGFKREELSVERAGFGYQRSHRRGGANTEPVKGNPEP